MSCRAQSPAASEQHQVHQSTEASDAAWKKQLRDVLTHSAGNLPSLATPLESILAGVSADDAVTLRRAMLKSERGALKAAGINPDEELADDWRQGGYPYNT